MPVLTESAFLAMRANAAKDDDSIFVAEMFVVPGPLERMKDEHGNTVWKQPAVKTEDLDAHERTVAYRGTLAGHLERIETERAERT